jgi:inosine-uridine nucleoside N-ribohydrolase
MPDFAFTTPTPGPPLHDALTIIHLTHPHLLKGRRGKLTVDTSKTEKDGETTFFPSSEEFFSEVEFGRDKAEGVENLVLEDLDVEAFFEVFLEVVARAEEVVAKVEM